MAKRIHTNGYRGTITGMRFLPAGEYNVGELDLSTNTIPPEWADHMVAIERATVLDDDADEPADAQEPSEDAAVKDAPDEAAEPQDEDEVVTTITVPTGDVNWDDYIVPDLREMAKARSIKGYSTMNRQALIDAIEGSEPDQQ